MAGFTAIAELAIAEVRRRGIIKSQGRTPINRLTIVGAEDRTDEVAGAERRIAVARETRRIVVGKDERTIH